jgi:hypothetical protein
MIGSIQNLDVLRVRVPGGPSLRIDEIREGGLASGSDVNLIVRKEVRLLWLKALGPMNLIVPQCAVSIERESPMCRRLRMTVHAEY